MNNLEDFVIEDGVLKEYKGTSKSVVIPDSVHTIGYRTFYNTDTITDVIIPNSVHTIDDWAFCDNLLSEIEIPDSVHTIGYRAFSANQLKNIHIPNSVHTIRGQAFCINDLTDVTISDSVKEIGNQAFDQNQLTSIHIPDSVYSIGQQAFDNNPNITSINGQKAMCTDGFTMLIDNQKTLGEYTIYKARFYGKSMVFGINFEECYVAERNGVFAHGETIKKAVEDVDFKFLKQKDFLDTIKSIKEKGVVTISDYRIITGACQFGIEHFMKQNNITSHELPIDDALKLTKGYYGHDKLKEVIS